MKTLAIEMENVTKVFPGIVANDKVCLKVEQGEIHALLGENGAGKSTLMSMLFGLNTPDEGTIKIMGREVQIRSPNDSVELKIGMVHQHFKLVHNFTVTENIILGREKTSHCLDSFGNLNLAEAEKRIAALSETYGLAVDPKARIDDISVGMQQRVEILKVLYRDAEILIFDEPTSVLIPQEIDELLLILSKLKAEGKTILFITHKLKEIKAVADCCTILRRGKTIGTVNVADVTEDELAEKMVGRVVNLHFDKKAQKLGPEVLRIEDLIVLGANTLPAVRGLSLNVRGGEIVGIAGIDGNGQSELVEALAGLRPAKAGNIILNGKDITKAKVRTRNENGMGMVPEDRHKHGLVLDFRADENLVIKQFYKSPYSTHGFLQFNIIVGNAERLISQFDIRAGKGPSTVARSMSGGNQQKLVMARELDRSPSLLVVAQPTRGLDVGAIEYIHHRLIEERDKGRGILLVSFELDEILSLCDRIAAISKGVITGIVPAAEADERKIGAMMGGLVNKEHENGGS